MNLQSDQDQPHILLAAPIMPGKTEAWRRLAQEIAGWQRCEYIMSRRALGITAEWLWLTSAGTTVIAVVAVMGQQPERILGEMLMSKRPFDRWFCQQLEMILAIDLKRFSSTPPEKVLCWKERRYGVM